MGHVLVLTVVLFHGLRFLPLHCGKEPQRRPQRLWASSALLVVKTLPRAPLGQDLLACPEALSPCVPPPCVRHLPGGLLCRCASVCLDGALEPLSPSSPALAPPRQAARAGPQQVGAGPRAPVSRGQSPEEERDVARPVTAEVVLWFPRCPAVYGYMLFPDQPGHFVFNGQKLFI